MRPLAALLTSLALSEASSLATGSLTINGRVVLVNVPSGGGSYPARRWRSGRRATARTRRAMK